MIVRIKIFAFLVWNLFKVAILLKPTGVYYKSCSLCNGIIHTKISSSENTETGEYRADFQCNKCGAIGKVNEIWVQHETVISRREEDCHNVSN